MKWVKVNPDFEILYRLMDGLEPDTGRRYWVRTLETERSNCDIGSNSAIKENMEPIRAEETTFSAMSHYALTRVEEILQ